MDHQPLAADVFTALLIAVRPLRGRVVLRAITQVQGLLLAEAMLRGFCRWGVSDPDHLGRLAAREMPDDPVLGAVVAQIVRGRPLEWRGPTPLDAAVQRAVERHELRRFTDRRGRPRAAAVPEAVERVRRQLILDLATAPPGSTAQTRARLVTRALAFRGAASVLLGAAGARPFVVAACAPGRLPDDLSALEQLIEESVRTITGGFAAGG